MRSALAFLVCLVAPYICASVQIDGTAANFSMQQKGELDFHEFKRLICLSTPGWCEKGRIDRPAANFSMQQNSYVHYMLRKGDFDKKKEIEYKSLAKLVAFADLDQAQKSDNASAKSYTPVVFWHGMDDMALGPRLDTNRLALQRAYPGMKVFSIQGGNSTRKDKLMTYFVWVPKQVERACQVILENEDIKASGAINGIGFGQGALFMRALIQRCPLREHGIRVKNFISLGGPHQGISGNPSCNYEEFVCANIILALTSGEEHSDFAKVNYPQAQYWHDPTREDVYKGESIFLPDINNENTLNQTYKDNLLALENLVLVLFQQDEILVPRESSLFGFYEPGQNSTIRPLEKSPLYLEDRLGLKQLNESGRLKMISIPGKHLEYEMTWFLEQIAAKYLDN